MSGHWVISWPAYEPTGRPGDSLVAKPAATWITHNDLTQTQTKQYQEAGATVRFVPAPANHKPPPAKPAPDVKVNNTPRPPAPAPDDIDVWEVEHQWNDDGQDIEISVPYEDEDRNAKTLTLTYTYEHVKTSRVIGGADAYLVVDSGGLYKMSTDGAVLEGEVEMTDELQEMFSTTHIDGAGNVYGVTLVDNISHLTKNGNVVTPLREEEWWNMGSPVADYDGNVFIGAVYFVSEGTVHAGILVSSEGNLVWEKDFGLLDYHAPWYGCAGDGNFYFTDGVGF